jgi:hypothetical protein
VLKRAYTEDCFMTRTLAGLGFTLALVLAGATSASAQTTERPVPPGSVVQPTSQTRTELRQSQQWQDIQNAIAQGRIDPREAARLTRLMDGIQRYQERAYSDGVLSLREQSRLERYQTRLDREVARAATR